MLFDQRKIKSVTSLSPKGETRAQKCSLQTFCCAEIHSPALFPNDWTRNELKSFAKRLLIASRKLSSPNCYPASSNCYPEGPNCYQAPTFFKATPHAPEAARNFLDFDIKRCQLCFPLPTPFGSSKLVEIVIPPMLRGYECSLATGEVWTLS